MLSKEYFIDGLAEETLNALVRVSRASGDRSNVGSSPQAKHGLSADRECVERDPRAQGSVRKAGNRFASRSQLIAASDGTHL
jgi:TolB-like protein